MSKLTVVLLSVIGIIIAAGLLIEAVIWICRFRWELKFLNAEIRRADEKERRYWEGERKRLWLSLIPFYRSRKRKHSKK